jgi:ABC-type glycerol-3-phosphate transport system substrate-binding protein
MKRFAILAVLFAFLGAGLLFASGEQEAAAAGAAPTAAYAPAQKVDLVLWHSYSGFRQELFNSLVKEWIKGNPMINIKLEYGGSLWSMRDKLLTAIAGGSGPHLAEIDSYWTPIFAEPGALVKLEPYMAADARYNKADLQRPSLESTQYLGESYSIPFNLSTIVMYFNKPMFKAAGLDQEKAPADWDELLAFGKKLSVDKNGDGVPDQWGLTFPNKANMGAIWYWLAFFWQQDGRLFNDALNAGAFNSAAGATATNYWRTLAREKVMSLSPGWADFQAELAAIELSSSSVLGGYRDSMGGSRFGLAGLPKGKTRATVTGGGNMAMFSACPDKQAGWAFLSWMGSTDVNKRWALATGAIPVRKSVIEEPEYRDYLLSDPKGNVMISTLEYAHIRPNIPEYGDASRIIAFAVEEALVNDLDPKPLLDKAKAEVDALFK